MSIAQESDAPSGRVESRRRLLPTVSTRGLTDTRFELEAPYSSSAPGATVDLSAYWLSLVRRKWTVLISILAALAAGAVVTLLSRPLYTAQTTL